MVNERYAISVTLRYVLQVFTSILELRVDLITESELRFCIFESYMPIPGASDRIQDLCKPFDNLKYR